MLDHFYCRYNLMAPTQLVITPDGVTLRLNTKNFINGLVTLVRDYQNYDIRFEGNTDFLTGLAHQIYNYNNLHYTTGLHIMVNGGEV